MQNKSKKFVMLASYVVAVLCLLAGLFLPLFNGKEVLALKLGEVFKCLMNKDNSFSLPYTVNLFGIESAKFDFMALVIVLYTVITALALLAAIPVALSIRKEGKVAKKFYYGIEIAAVIALSLILTVTLFKNEICYNVIIALGGTVLALLVLCGLDKGRISSIKIVLFVLSAIGFLALFDYVVLLSKQDAFASFTDKISSAMTSEGSGVDYLYVLFASKISDTLGSASDIKSKALIIFGAITATLVLINFFIDAVKLATKKDGKSGRIFDVARYGLEVIAAVCLLITVLINKDESLGLMLIVILAVAAVQLIIAIVRIILGFKKSDNERAVSEVNEITANTVIDIDPVEEETKPADEYKAEEYKVDSYHEEPYDDDGYTAPTEDDFKEPDYVEPEYDELIHPTEEVQPAEEVEAEKSEDTAVAEDTATKDAVEEEPTDEVFYEPEVDSAYLLPADGSVNEVKEPEKPAEEPEVEKVEEPAAEEVATENDVEENVEEPVEESEEIIEEPEEPKESEEPEKAETPAQTPEVQRPYREDIKPYNPYERHSNPFRAFEQQSSQPYNPYRQQEKPDKPAYEKPAQQPARHTYEKPVQQFKPQSTRPLQPRPIIQEFKPVPPISEQPPKEPQVYTIDTIYAGPMDDFIRKLTNDERIEFAKTFIEKNRGNLGSIPDYVVGGDNKKFFSVSFIYLGRIRGLVSDGLLNKMYKELNLL